MKRKKFIKQYFSGKVEVQQFKLVVGVILSITVIEKEKRSFIFKCDVTTYLLN